MIPLDTLSLFFAASVKLLQSFLGPDKYFCLNPIGASRSTIRFHRNNWALHRASSAYGGGIFGCCGNIPNLGSGVQRSRQSEAAYLIYLAWQAFRAAQPSYQNKETLNMRRNRQTLFAWNSDERYQSQSSDLLFGISATIHQSVRWITGSSNAHAWCGVHTCPPLSYLALLHGRLALLATDSNAPNVHKS